MDRTLTTIAVVPRERFGYAIKSLESLFENTNSPFELVYVDAGSPRSISRRLAELAERWNFTLVRCEKYLTPNQARNLALEFVKTKYVAFADNDVVFGAGWLSALERCAEETSASVVGPLTCAGQPSHSVVHHAGEDPSLIEENGKMIFRTSAHKFVDEPVSRVRHQLSREPTAGIEFHTVLVRKSLFDDYGKLDENNMSMFDHMDLSLTALSNGKEVFFEPDAVVTYVFGPLRLSELPYFMLRWSDRWTAHSLESFLRKWRAEDGRPNYTALDYVRLYRGWGMPKMHKRAVDLLGWRIGKRIIVAIESGLAMWANRNFAGLGEPAKFTVVHAGSGFTEIESAI